MKQVDKGSFLNVRKLKYLRHVKLKPQLAHKDVQYTFDN